MNTTKKYGGVVVPAVTPLTEDFRLDEEAVERMFHNFRRHGVHPFILGTTGEAPSLPASVKEAYIKKAAAVRQPGDVLYAGISSNSLEESVELAKRSFDAGIDVVAATLPSYYALSESGMKRYFEQLAESIPGPLIIYNIPATTHMSIPLAVVDELSRHEKIVGAKDSERSEERLQESLRLWKDRSDFSHFLGWAAQSANALLGGGDGLIPSTGNLYPQIYSDMAEAVRLGNREEAFRLQRLSDVFGSLYQSGRLLGASLAALKVLMEDAGLCGPHMMPPLEALGAEERRQLRSTLHELAAKEEMSVIPA
ncbi:dihydrodipicolinate synthase family protein [Paraflavisolibacter sp. H34]|uniref:dihydrodipicolinate synthase family protein n=1 Tax=Huijunlia imazamoxiresistens TaxID=3127457 RepID=UPI0030174DF9